MSDQQTVIDTVFRLLQRLQRWPEWAELDYELDNAANLPDPWGSVRAVDRPLLWGVGELRPSDEQQVGLTIAGLAACPAAVEDVAAFIEVVRYAAAVAKAAPPKVPVTLTPEEIRRRVPLPAAGRGDLLARQGAIWQVNGYLRSVYSAGTEPGHWSVTFDRAQLRTMRGIEDVADYLRVVESVTHSSAVPVGQPEADSAGAAGVASEEVQRIEEVTAASGAVYHLNRGERLGVGGQGEVYAGVDDHGRQVAIKRVRLRDYTSAMRNEDLRYAEREALVSAHLDGSELRHVLPLLDHAESSDALVLVYPRAEMSLADVVALVGGLPEASASGNSAARARFAADRPDSDVLRRIAAELATGLAELHEHGVLHRDVKPANALFYEDHWVWGDLGIARLVSAFTATYTWRDVGSLEYRAPEVTRGERATQRSDVYSLGCTVFAAATGSPPFIGGDVVRAHAEAPPELAKIEDLGLRNAVGAMLRKSPGARPAAAQVVEMLTDAPAGAVYDALRRHALSAGARVDHREAVAGRFAARAQLAEDALAQMDRLWDSLTSAVQRISPMARADRGSSAWVLAVDDRRVVIRTARPASDRCPALQLGLVTVETEGETYRSDVANLYAVPDNDGFPVWNLLRLVPNDLAVVRVPVTVTFADRCGAVGLPDLEEHLRQRADGVAPKSVVVREDSPLTVTRLLELFVAEVEAMNEESAASNDQPRSLHLRSDADEQADRVDAGLRDRRRAETDEHAVRPRREVRRADAAPDGPVA